jgi:hypothetical protein
MNRSLVDQIAAAVLYEGYILYPYRPSVKNRQRWTFGGLNPRAWCEAKGNGDAWAMQTECLIAGPRDATVNVRVRFLQLVARTVGELSPPLVIWPTGGDPLYRPVESLRIGERLYQTWQEATEREILTGDWRLSDLAHARTEVFNLSAARSLEPLRNSEGNIVGVLERRQQTVSGAVAVSATALEKNLFKVTVRIVNETPAIVADRDDAQLRSLVSTHAVLNVAGGEFVSLTDPPDGWREAAAGCRNIGCWPVLVGNEGDKDTMLASPIILPDYPQIAPESPGELFDGTEIDEILTLRILTLTEDEKRSAMAVDDRARKILERTEALAHEQLAGLHGTVRDLRRVEEAAANG